MDFIRGSFKVLSYDVIIYKILIQMDVVDIVKLCSSSPEFQTFCNRYSTRIWTMLLRRDYPQFGIVGDPKEHYIKIFSGEGEDYHFLDDRPLFFFVII